MTSFFLLLLLFSPAMSRVEEQPMTFSNTPYACLALRGIFRTWMGPPNRALFEGVVLGRKKGTGFRALRDTVQNSRKEVTIIR
jgi:hypothetical protein